MNIKLVEIRDKGTFIPAFAIKPNPRSEEERYLLARSGYGREAHAQEQYVILGRLCDNQHSYDPYDWGNRTMQQAHTYLMDCWDQVVSGQVIDVEFILGESKEPKKSESVTS